MAIKTKLHFDGGYDYTINVGNSKKITKNFTMEEEANCSADEAIKLEIWTHTLVHARMRQEFRDWWGRAIKCESCYRTPAFNKKVGGVSNSLHLWGCASDLSLGNLNDTTWTNCVNKWQAICAKYGTVGEIGRYIWGIHIGSHIECTSKYTNKFYIFDSR